MKLAGKVVVLTGAGSGIGRALALALLERGARVAAIDKNAATLHETVSLAAPRAEASGAEQVATFTADITRRAEVEALPGLVAQFGAPDALINCAGIIQPFVRLKELDYATIDRVFDVNFRGTLYMTKAFLPGLLQRPEAHVVNISSMGGFVPFPGQTVYGASKAAVKLLTEGLAAELAQTNVHVTVVFPGAVATNIAANSGVAVRGESEAQRASVYSAEAAARDILRGVERDRPRVVVGRDAKVLDKMSRLAPVRAARFISRQMKGFLPPL